MEITFRLALLTAVCLATPPACQGNFATFRSLFVRVPNQRLSAIAARQDASAKTVNKCAQQCAQENAFQCKSFDFDNMKRWCLLFGVSVDDKDVYLIASDHRDHYKTAYTKLFHRLPNHMLTTSHNRRVDSVSVEECARRCVLEVIFKCSGFDYAVVDRTCWLTELTPERAGGVSIDSGWDYYERSPEGPLDRFVNYGFGQMRMLASGEVYQRVVMGVTMEHCATLCLGEQTFDCISFDYRFNNEDHSTCHLSKYIAANVYGLVASYDHKVMHFEKKQKYLAYFYANPYAVILGNNHKTYTRVTPDRCARMCLEEESFVCRSFDYKIEDGTCLLSSKTGSDVGGLFDQGLREVHHFEMKPMLDCGGNLTSDEGNFASPNWPRNYGHHETCVWNITVRQHKVILLQFKHLDLGMLLSDPCSPQEDRVIIQDDHKSDGRTYCVLPNTSKYVTKSNQATVTFISNGQGDGQGFRIFYTAEWPCDVSLTRSPGELASPNWPSPYPPSARCSWRLTAPPDSRVRVHFTHFTLEQHTLGHCNDKYDHVFIQDGGTVSSPRIGLYCGTHAPFTVRSSGQDMIIQFRSDLNVGKSGFHAIYAFENQNGSVITEGTGGDGLIVPLDSDSLGEDVAGEPGTGKRLQGDAEVVDVGSVHAQRQYRTTMWAVISTLLCLLLVLGVALYLVWQRHRALRRGQQEQVQEDVYMEELPLRQTCATRDSPIRQFNNEVDLSNAAAASKDAAFANLLYQEPATSRATKNINVDKLNK